MLSCLVLSLMMALVWRPKRWIVWWTDLFQLLMTNLLMVGTMSNNLHTTHTHTARYTCMWHHVLLTISGRWRLNWNILMLKLGTHAWWVSEQFYRRGWVSTISWSKQQCSQKPFLSAVRFLQHLSVRASFLSVRHHSSVWGHHSSVWEHLPQYSVRASFSIWG